MLPFRRGLIRSVDSVHNLLNKVTVILTKGPATCNDIVDYFVTRRSLDAIFSTLKSIVDDIVTCGMALSQCFSLQTARSWANAGVVYFRELCEVHVRVHI